MLMDVVDVSDLRSSAIICQAHAEPSARSLPAGVRVHGASVAVDVLETRHGAELFAELVVRSGAPYVFTMVRCAPKLKGAVCLGLRNPSRWVRCKALQRHCCKWVAGHEHIVLKRGCGLRLHKVAAFAKALVRAHATGCDAGKLRAELVAKEWVFLPEEAFAEAEL